MPKITTTSKTNFKDFELKSRSKLRNSFYTQAVLLCIIEIFKYFRDDVIDMLMRPLYNNYLYAFLQKKF